MHSMNGPCTPLKPVGISGVGHYLPERRLTNEDLVALGSPVSADWILRKTGIRTRYMADERQALSDLVIPSAKAALSSAGLSPQDLSALIVSGDLHDSGGVQLTSAIVARALGVEGLACLDLRVGCPASVVALHQGTALVAGGLATRILVAAGEVNSRSADRTDRASVWFGDGAGAVVLEACAPGTGILVSYIGGTGTNSEILAVPAGGSREPLTAEGLAAGRHRLQMDSHAVFGFAVERMVENLELVTAHIALAPGQLDWIIPHQANLRIIEAAMEKLRLPMQKVYLNIHKVGNTAGASVLLALSEAVRNGCVKPGQLIATVGFGGGLAWGAQVIRMNHPEDFGRRGL